MKISAKMATAVPIVLSMHRQGRTHQEMAAAAGIGKSLVARILNNLPKILSEMLT